MSVTEQALCDEIKALSGIETKKLMEIGLLPAKYAKKWLVKQQYFVLAKTGRTYTDIKYELSEKYGVSVSTIEKMIYRKP